MALERFVANEENLSDLTEIKRSHLSKSLLGDTQVKEGVWAKVPAQERSKLAVIASLYLKNGTVDFCDYLEKYYAREVISILEIEQIMEKGKSFSGINNAVMLRGDRKDLIAKYREYFRLLAIGSE